MAYNPKKHHRRSIRLKGYDYSKAGLYFITICVQNRACLYGNIVDGKMNLNDAGIMVEKQWLELPQRFTNIQLHEYIVMPNHFHAILEIVVGTTLVVDPNNTDTKNGTVVPNKKRQPQGIAPTIPPTAKNKTVGDMVGAFQSIATVEYIRGVKNQNWEQFDKKLWQRNYWEHIIRNDTEYHRVANYIINNPAKWNDDQFFN